MAEGGELPTHPLYETPSRFISLGLALPMIMHWQTIVGSGAKYISKVQLYIFIDLQ